MQRQFGQRVRLLREQHGWTQQQLADALGVSVSYVSKVERDKLHFGDYPSEKFIHKLAAELEADEDELLMLTDRVPAGIRKRIHERPDVFRVVAGMDDKQMDEMMVRFSSTKQ